MGTRTITIVCEVDTEDDSISGSASRRGGEEYEFTGWIGLIGVLQVLFTDTDPNGAPPG